MHKHTDINFIDDANVADKRYAFPSDNPISGLSNDDELTDEAYEKLAQYYDDLLKRATDNAARPSTYQEDDESVVENIMRRHIRTDDYPIWKIGCKVSILLFPTYKTMNVQLVVLLDWPRRNSRLLIVACRQGKRPVAFSLHSRFHTRRHISGVPYD